MAFADHGAGGDSKTRFTSRVGAYVAARPTYPHAVIEHLRRDIGLTSAWTIADIGAGTGISARLFLENGNTVVAVEPNTAMRQAADASLRVFANYRSVNASAEATTLADQSIDLVTAAQAFHWFDRSAARREFARILKPGGWTLLMWNDRLTGGTPFLAAYEKFLRDFGDDYLKVRHNNISDEILRDFFSPGEYRTATFPNAQQLDLAGLTARVLSSSYMPGAGHPRKAAMLEALRQLFEQFERHGRVTIAYATKMYYGQTA